MERRGAACGVGRAGGRARGVAAIAEVHLTPELPEPIAARFKALAEPARLHVRHALRVANGRWAS